MLNPPKTVKDVERLWDDTSRIAHLIVLAADDDIELDLNSMGDPKQELDPSTMALSRLCDEDLTALDEEVFSQSMQ